MNYPFGETVTLVREAVTGEDADGNDVYTPTNVAVPNSVFAPAGSVERLQGQDLVTSTPTVYLGLVDVSGNPVTPKATDKVRRENGDVYEVDGKPAIYPPNPFTGTQVGPVLRLKDVTG